MGKCLNLTGILVDDSISVSFIEICQDYEISEDILHEFLEYGLLHDMPSSVNDMRFSQAHLQRILSAFRLHTDLNINAHGVILALELMDELVELRHQVNVLQRHLDSSDHEK